MTPNFDPKNQQFLTLFHFFPLSVFRYIYRTRKHLSISVIRYNDETENQRLFGCRTLAQVQGEVRAQGQER
jgi:hypothetical protein